MRSRWDDPSIKREVNLLQEAASGLSEEAGREVMARAYRAGFLSWYAWALGEVPGDPEELWERMAQAYHGVTDNLALAWDVAKRAAH